MKSLRHFCLAGLVAASLSGLVDAAPRKLLSPPGKAQIRLAGAKITITYHRPKIRDPKTRRPRKIFGPGAGYLVPYGQVWRLGANQATTLSTTRGITLAGKPLAAGSYTLFAIPEARQWTLIISKKTGEWGIPYPGKQYDLAREPMQAHYAAHLIDPFTISLHRTGARTAELRLAWAHTVVTAPLSLH